MGYLLPNGKTLPAEKDLQAPCEMISGLRGALQSGHENCSKRLAVGEKNWSCPSIDDVGNSRVHQHVRQAPKVSPVCSVVLVLIPREYLVV